MKICVFGSMGLNNVGDEAYIEVSLRTIRQQYPAAEISMISYDPDNSRALHDVDDVCLMPRMNKELASKPTWLRRLLSLTQCLQYLLVFILGTARICPDPQVRSVIKQIKHADVLVGFGGGLLNDHYPGTSLVYLGLLLAAKRLGKKTALLAQSVGPILGPVHHWLARKILPGIDLITVREKTSLAFLLRMGVPSDKLSLTLCPAFLLEPAPAEHFFPSNFLTENSPLIGLAVRRWHYPDEDSPEAAQHAFIETMGLVVDQISSTLGAKIVIIPTIPEDVLLGEDILQRCGAHSRVALLLGNPSPRELVGICGKLDMMVTTNFHPLLFATSQGVASVTLSLTGHKTTGFAELAGLRGYIVTPTELCLETIAKQVLHLWDELEFEKQALQVAIPRLSALATSSLNRFNEIGLGNSKEEGTASNELPLGNH